MEFCLNLSHHPWVRAESPGAAAAKTLETIRVADAAGLDSVWLSEDPDGWDAFAVLSAAARMTERIRLGTGVTNPYLRHPNLLAMSVATLDQLSDGRAFLGLGRGQPEWYERRLGIEVGRPLAALSDTVDLLHQWWQPPYRASVDDEFHVSDWPHAFGPMRSPPIYLAALGPKAIRLAAEKFDGLMMSEFASESFLKRLVDDLNDLLTARGLALEKFPIFVRTAIEVTDDPEPALERRKTLIALIHTLPGMSRHMEVPGFDIAAIMARVREAMHTDEVLAEGGAFIDMRKVADFEAARRAIPTELVDELSYVGSPEKIKRTLQRLEAIGISHVFVTPPKHLDAQEFAEMLDALRT
jgi:5,10-methylenetetrahydromethanopterin reductase